MQYRARKNFSSIRLGNVVAGQVIDIDCTLARQMVDRGILEVIEVEPPKSIAGQAGKPSFASQAGQASPEINASTLEKSRKPDSVESSPSTQAVLPQNGPMSTTPVIESGGSDTKKKRARKPKDSQQIGQ